MELNKKDLCYLRKLKTHILPNVLIKLWCQRLTHQIKEWNNERILVWDIHVKKHKEIRMLYSVNLDLKK